MTELPRYSTNAIVMMEIDDDLDDEEQPLATDPDGDWVKWADVSSRLHQLETAAMLKDRTRLAIRERSIAGESHASLAEDFGVPEAFVKALCDWQLFADETRTRVEQLEQEKATLREFVDRCAELGATDTDIIKHALEDQARIRAEMTPLSIEASELRAALAETREALQQLIAAVERDDNPRDEGLSEHSDDMQKARAVLSRVDSQGADRSDSVSQLRVGDTSTDR